MLSLPLKIPMCEPSTERGKLEEEFIRNVTLSSLELTSLAKPLMKMFAVRIVFLWDGVQWILIHICYF